VCHSHGSERGRLGILLMDIYPFYCSFLGTRSCESSLWVSYCVTPEGRDMNSLKARLFLLEWGLSLRSLGHPVSGDKTGGAGQDCCIVLVTFICSINFPVKGVIFTLL
jgi:hypothetical protein